MGHIEAIVSIGHESHREHKFSLLLSHLLLRDACLQEALNPFLQIQHLTPWDRGSYVQYSWVPMEKSSLSAHTRSQAFEL